MATHGITFPFVSEDRISDPEWYEDEEELDQYLVELDEYLANDCECCRLRKRPYTRFELICSVEEEALLRKETAGEKKADSRREKARRRQRSHITLGSP